MDVKTKTKTMLLTDDIYLRVGLISLLRDVTDIIPADMYSGINLMLSGAEKSYDYFIVDERAIQGVLNHFLLKNYSARLDRTNTIYLSSDRVPSKSGIYRAINISSNLNGLRIYFSSFMKNPPVTGGISCNGFFNKRKLTNKESEVLRHLVTGMDAYKIARCTGCSIKTVYTHKYNVLDKLGFKSLKHLVIFLNEIKKIKYHQKMNDCNHEK